MRELLSMNVLLVEDDRDLAELLCELLRINQYNVLAASSLREARAVLPTFDPVLVILDRGLPDGDGLSLLPALTTRLVIVLTASPPEYVVQSLDQGADDFLLKPFVPSELLARIRALVRRKQSTGEPVTAFGNVRLGERPFIKVAQDVVLLRPREYDMLSALIERHPRVAKRAWMLEKHMDDADCSPTSISVHVSRLRKALSDAGASLTIRSIQGVGYRLEDAKR
ncbi:response regulator transcription factor [Gemmatimonas sp.]|uniref:response regulator transcription factor n=2 Tax=Gemmatimonas sp. TaxID=1962908 RepID=UPI003DA3FBEE